ncbi:hypothetical protein GEV33_003057 [Tenebrio molitor]|uniref:Uncharacterized protein n=1 Tax=Tenebrio molitor TaxID=7067 RepID=A0A8J6HS26_TENMO|nr:hypothetical protein GEV33_003057 [Tenebrio molitor]
MNMVMADAGNYPETAIINIRLGGAVEYFRLMFGAFEKMMMRSREEGPARASRHGMNYSEEEEEERSGWNSLRKMSEEGLIDNVTANSEFTAGSTGFNCDKCRRREHLVPTALFLFGFRKCSRKCFFIASISTDSNSLSDEIPTDEETYITSFRQISSRPPAGLNDIKLIPDSRTWKCGSPGFARRSADLAADSTRDCRPRKALRAISPQQAAVS